MRFRADPTLRVLPGNDGRTRVLGGSPLRLWTVTDGGRRLLASAVAGDDVAPGAADGAVARLLTRFVDAGALHPVPDRVGSVAVPTVDEVSIVVPVRDRATELDHLLGALAPAVAAGAEVVVVDDGSADAAAHERVAASHGAVVLRRERSGGPAVARDDGIAATGRPFVAVIDSDCDPCDGWLDPLLAHLADDGVGAVAPRVLGTIGAGGADRVDTGSAGPDAMAVYERFRSPLDLGDEPARVAPRTRVSYVPSAALLLRRDAYERVGGFDRSLRVGEDVDLVWRLVDAGWRVRYEPTSEVGHRPRGDWRGWWRQRASYGESAALLEERHPGQVAPVRCSPWSAAGWASVAAGHPLVGAGVLLGSAATLPRKLPGVPAAEAIRLAADGHLGAGRQLARAVVRVWWPVALVVAVPSRRARRVLVASAAVVAVDATLQARRAHRATSAASARTALMVGLVAVVDDVAYGTGVWRGCLRSRSFRALLPSFPRSSHRL